MYPIPRLLEEISFKHFFDRRNDSDNGCSSILLPDAKRIQYVQEVSKLPMMQLFCAKC